jgi:hypothetical protein
LSHRGAGLVVFGPPWPRYPSEQHLLIRLDADQDSSNPDVGFLEGMVRNTSATEEGWLRVGVEFIALTPTQQATTMQWVRRLLPDI